LLVVSRRPIGTKDRVVAITRRLLVTSRGLLLTMRRLLVTRGRVLVVVGRVLVTRRRPHRHPRAVDRDVGSCLDAAGTSGGLGGWRCGGRRGASCAKECSWGADWSCLGREDWPASTKATTLTVDVFDLQNGTPIDDATVKVCGFFDALCNSPIPMANTGDSGTSS
jgi:hypothetical protein